MGEKIIYLAKCGCGFENGRTDRQVLACERHYSVLSLATLTKPFEDPKAGE